MATRRAQRRDPLSGIIESAFQPGNFIEWNEGFSFVSELSELESDVAKLVKTDPSRAAALYETLIAECDLKAEEVDDSGGEFGIFAGSLYGGWIKARQAAGADREQTAKRLLAWMDDDEYGFCDELERSAPGVLDRAGLEAFEREVRARFNKECAAPAKRARPAAPNPTCARDRWGGMLRAIYAQQRNIEKYLDLTAKTALTQEDCEAIATIFQAKRKLNDALAWLDRGMAMHKPGAFQDGVSYQLAEMRRGLLVKLGRGGEALDSAWAEFQADPDTSGYEELIRYAPKKERAAWHEKAMAAAEAGELDSMIDLWLAVKETGRLAARLDRASDSQLEGLSHYVTEPAAKRLAKTHPAVAARVFRALCVRIIDARKSKYYFEALSHLDESRRCYQAAGLDGEWQALVAEIRRDHRRKSGFMPGFEAVVAGRRVRGERRRRW